MRSRVCYAAAGPITSLRVKPRMVARAVTALWRLCCWGARMLRPVAWLFVSLCVIGCGSVTNPDAGTLNWPPVVNGDSGTSNGGGTTSTGGGNTSTGGGDASTGGGNASTGGGNASTGGGSASTGGGSTSTGGGSTSTGGGNASTGGGASGGGDAGGPSHTDFDLPCSRGWCAMTPLPLGVDGRAVSAGGGTVAIANAQGLIWRRDNLHWALITPVSLGVTTAIHVFHARDIWAVGPERITHFDGVTWTALVRPADMRGTLTSVWGADPSTVWFVGDGGGSQAATKIWRWSNGAFTAFNFGPTYPLWGVWGTDASNVYFVGESSQVYRFNGVGVSRETVPPGDYFAVGGSSANDIHLVGSVSARWNGLTWAKTNGLTAWSVSATSPTRAWAVGPNGLMQFWDGGGWSTAPVASTHSLNGVVLTSPTEGWAVGAHSEVLHLAETTWVSVRHAPFGPIARVLSSAHSTFTIAEDGSVAQRLGNALVPRPERQAQAATHATDDGLWVLSNNSLQRATSAGFTTAVTCPTSVCDDLNSAPNDSLTFRAGSNVLSVPQSLWQYQPSDAGLRNLAFESLAQPVMVMPELLVAPDEYFSGGQTYWSTFAPSSTGWVRTSNSNWVAGAASPGRARLVEREGALFTTFQRGGGPLANNRFSSVWVNAHGEFSDATPTLTAPPLTDVAFEPFNASSIFVLQLNEHTISHVEADGGLTPEDLFAPRSLACEPNRRCTAVGSGGVVYFR